MPNQEDFEIALAIACKDFGQRDPSLQAEKAGVPWIAEGGAEGGHAEVPFLATPYVIRAPAAEVSYKEDQGKEPALWEQILVLHHGQVVERGDHATLLRRGGLYRRLYELQVRQEGRRAP